MSSPLAKFWGLLCSLALVVTMLGAPGAQAAPAGVGEARSLGVPLRDTLLIGGIVGTIPDGTRVLWSVVSGTPAYVNAVDPTTGEVRVRVPLPGGQGSYAIRQAPDGTLYVATYNAAHLFRIAPGSTVAEDLGNPVPGETYIWSLALAPDGMLYGGTSPGGKVFSYDTSTGAVRDYGRIAAGQTYVKSLAWADGKLYGGAYASWEVTELDPVTGTTRPLPVPPGVEPAGKQVYDLNAWDGFLYARGDSAFPGTLHVYDLASGAWVHRVDGAAGLDVSPPGDDGRVWFFRQYEAGSSELVGFDPRTGAVQRTGLKAWGRIVNSRGIGWAEVNDPDYPGQSIVALGWRSMMFRFNPTTGATSTLRAQIPGEPTPVLALAAGDSGQVWAGGFLQGGIARVATADGATEYKRFSQVEHMLWHDGELIIGAYPDARVYRYDPARTWYSPEYSDEAPTQEANPLKLLDLKSHGQSRLKGLTVTAGKIVSGSTPANDTLGGTLAVMDRATGAVERIRDQLITDEGIFGLTSDGSSPVVYGVTTVAGGLSTTPPTQASATVFAYDVTTDAVLWEAHPDGAKTYQAIQMDAAGQLWMIATGKVLQLDPRTGAVVRTIDTGVTGSFELLALGEDGRSLYAMTGGSRVTLIDTLTGEATHLFDQAGSKMVHTNGELVFAVDTELVARAVPSTADLLPTIEATVRCTTVDLTVEGAREGDQLLVTGFWRGNKEQRVTVDASSWSSGKVPNWRSASSVIVRDGSVLEATRINLTRPDTCGPGGSRGR